MKRNYKTRKVLDEKKELSRRGGVKPINSIISFLIKLMAIIIPVATAFVVIYNQTLVRQTILKTKQDILLVFAQMSVPANNTKDDIISAVEQVINNELFSCAELLIGLFGIVISVWVGLNIYNAMKKDDYMELLNTITEKCKEHDDIQDKVEEVYKVNMKLHASYLCKTFDVNNNSSQYFYSLFSKYIDVSQLDYHFVLNASSLETLYVKITALHEKNEHDKMAPYIEEALERCQEMLQWINVNSENIPYKNKLHGYIAYRYGRIYFYQGMMKHYADFDNRSASLCFVDAAAQFQKAVSFDDAIPQNIDIFNTIGYIYIKIHMWNEDRLEPLYTPDELKSIIQTALKNCKKSKQDTVNSIKNLGIAYERFGDMNSAIQKYRESCNKAPHNYESHLCLASAYLKVAQKILEIEKYRSQLLNELDFKKAQKEKAQQYIRLARFELRIANKIDSQAPSHYYKLGQLYTYLMLLESDTLQKMKFKKQAQQNFDMSNSLIPSTFMHRFHERNFYEAIGDIKHALEINEKLDGTDTKHLRKLYEENLTKS